MHDDKQREMQSGSSAGDFESREILTACQRVPGSSGTHSVVPSAPWPPTCSAKPQFHLQLRLC